MTDERKGHTSASNAEYDSLCPGRHIAQKRWGEPEEQSEDASFGTHIHEALAGRMPVDQLTYDERECYERCSEVAARKVQEWFKQDADRVKVFAEQRYWINNVVPGDLAKNPEEILHHSGRCDRVYRHMQNAMVVDFKTLRGDIAHSARNLQVRDQVVLVRHHFLIQGPIAAVVIQPFVTMNPEICCYTQDDINTAQVLMWERVARSNRLDAPRNAGELQCKFCTYRTKCLEYGKFIGTAAVKTRKPFEVPVKEWTPQQCVEFMEGEVVIRKWIKESKKLILKRLKADPSSIPGLQIVKGDSRTRVTNPQSLFDRASKFGLKLDSYLECVNILNGAFREHMSAATGKRGKELDAIIDQLLLGLVETTQNEDSVELAKK